MWRVQESAAAASLESVRTVAWLAVGLAGAERRLETGLCRPDSLTSRLSQAVDGWLPREGGARNSAASSGGGATGSGCGGGAASSVGALDCGRWPPHAAGPGGASFAGGAGSGAAGAGDGGGRPRGVAALPAATLLHDTGAAASLPGLSVAPTCQNATLCQSSYRSCQGCAAQALGHYT